MEVRVYKARTVEQWADDLNDDWEHLRETTVSGFINIGKKLIDAGEELNKEAYTRLLNNLEFKRNTAGAFIRIAKWVAVGNAHIPLSSLPPDYTTIDKLIRLEPPKIKELVKSGVICPTLQRSEISKILHLETVAADQARVLALRPRPGKYRTIVVDPGWEYDAFSEGAVANMMGQYAKQSYDDLWKLDLKQWAEDECCHLYCWATNAYVLKAGALVEHWGFEYKQILTWVKPPPFGLGRNFRNATEQVLFAMIGERTTRVDNLPTWFTAPRGEHSEKPEEFYDVVRAASYPPYGEANQRKMRPDFTDLFMAGEPLRAAV